MPQFSAGHVNTHLHLAAAATGKDTFSKGPWEHQEGDVPFPHWLSAAFELCLGQIFWDRLSGQGFLSYAWKTGS